MPKTHPPYAPEYRRRMVGLVRAERTPGEPAALTTNRSLPQAFSAILTQANAASENH